jgi:hypothetical protein
MHNTHIPQRNANGNLGNIMKMKSQLNDTTRTFPRTQEDAFGDSYYDIQRQERWEWLEGHRSDAAEQAEFWVYITLAFAAGFLVSHIWG